MNSIKAINKAELALYSTLISLMGGLIRLKEGDAQGSKHVVQPEAPLDDPTVIMDLVAQPRTFALRWQSIQQGILALLMWIVLGFAAGFLIGMLRSG